ncbi:MAG: DUF1549 and DUF1553 domain-containing protein [Planctomycetota bacterium]
MRGITGCFLVVWMALAVPRVFGDAAQLTEQIDAYFTAHWQAQPVATSGPASDAEFLRRASLDLTGVIPTVHRVRTFLEDPRADKRALLIDELLQSPRHATHLANQWRNILLPNMSSVESLQAVAGTQTWLRERFLRNLRYDRLVGEFLTATGSAATCPVLYYQANEFKPEKLAAGTARSFFGIRLACAECHDHPFDDWKQEDFWSYAAFFARVRPSDRSMMTRTVSLVEAPDGEVTLPDQQQPVTPRFLDGGEADEETSRRVQLSAWAASNENPYIARAAANRVWALLMGRGLSEPVDDLGPHHPPDHPELLDQLAAGFIDTGYDLRELFRAIANSKVYQQSSRSEDLADAPAPEDFGRMLAKPLTPDQLFDSYCVALRYRRWRPLPVGSSNPALDLQRAQFVTAMSNTTANATEFRSGLQQTLMLMNGTEFAQLIDGQGRGTLAALEAPFLSASDRLEVLYLAALSRLPTAAEQSHLLARLPEDKQAQSEFWGDLLWALLNNAEFRTNH